MLFIHQELSGRIVKMRWDKVVYYRFIQTLL